jgi:hypothetical protein
MPGRTGVPLIEVLFQSYPSAADRLVSAESLGGLEVIGLGNGTGSRLLDRLRKNRSRNSSEVICNFLGRFALENHLSKVRLSCTVAFHY